MHDEIVLDGARQSDLHFDQMPLSGDLEQMKESVSRRAPDAAIPGFLERIHSPCAPPIVACDRGELADAIPALRVKDEQRTVGTDEVAFTGRRQERPNSGGVDSLLSAESDGHSAIEPHQSFRRAEPEKPSRIAAHALELVTRQTVGGGERANRQSLGERRGLGERQDDRKDKPADHSHDRMSGSRL
jgi:hypothetical protein